MSTDKKPKPRGRKQRANSGTPPRKGNAGSFKPGNPYRWTPGQSGNPNGAPRGPRISDLLREALGQRMPADAKQALKDLIEEGATIGQIIAMAVTLRASEGDLEALGAIADRTEGAPEQTFNLPGLNAEDLARARERAAAYEQERLGATAQPPAGGAPVESR